MMITAGVDIGSLSANAVILRDNEIISWVNILTGPDSMETGIGALEKARLGCSLSEVDYVVSTGYGRKNLPTAHKYVSEISCHARGTHFFFPDVRTILDIGGQDVKAIRCNEQGKVVNFIMNDKCAAGTGRFLERVAAALEIPLDEIGPLSFEIKERTLNINSFCAVFAENDILKSIREGKHPGDILSPVLDGLVDRTYSLFTRMGIEREFSISGGVAKNSGMVRRMEQKIGMKAFIAFEPQIVGALGAALFARDILVEQREKR
ncbi:MAG: acyl-CoA dehydratase activase [Thermodesulfobacteriota bacterium]|nr:acyl-CoA dehydratase activase [Thermodesulfobacteriota bacterium]